MKLLGCLAFLSLALMISCNKYVKNGDYFIKNVGFGTYVDACGSDDICPEDPNNLYVNNFFGDTFQQFTVKLLHNGYYHISSKVNGKRFEANESRKPANTLSLEKPNNNDLDQQFQIVANKYNSYSIIPRRLNHTAAEAPKKELEELFLGKINADSKAQRFVFEPVPEPEPIPEPPKKHDKYGKKEVVYAAPTPVRKTEEPAAAPTPGRKVAEPAKPAAPVRKTEEPVAAPAPGRKVAEPAAAPTPVRKTEKPAAAPTPVRKTEKPAAAAAPGRKVAEPAKPAAPVRKTEEPAATPAPSRKVVEPAVAAPTSVRKTEEPAAAAPQERKTGYLRGA